jgi:hypothetical protein
MLAGLGYLSCHSLSANVYLVPSVCDSAEATSSQKPKTPTERVGAMDGTEGQRPIRPTPFCHF